MKTLVLFFAALAAFAQTVPVDFGVQVLDSTTIKAKYGRALPAGITVASVTGVNRGNTTATFGQGYVIQQLRAAGYPVISQSDAKAIVQRAQGGGVHGVFNRWSPIAVKILDDLKDLSVLKVVSFGAAADAAIVSADAIAKVVQPDIAGVLQAIDQAYENDGIQPLMQIAPGGSLEGKLLMSGVGVKPNVPAGAIVRIDVPVLVAPAVAAK